MRTIANNPAHSEHLIRDSVKNSNGIVGTITVQAPDSCLVRNSLIAATVPVSQLSTIFLQFLFLLARETESEPSSLRKVTSQHSPAWIDSEGNCTVVANIPEIAWIGIKRVEKAFRLSVGTPSVDVQNSHYLLYSFGLLGTIIGEIFDISLVGVDWSVGLATGRKEYEDALKSRKIPLHVCESHCQALGYEVGWKTFESWTQAIDTAKRFALQMQDPKRRIVINPETVYERLEEFPILSDAILMHGIGWNHGSYRPFNSLDRAIGFLRSPTLIAEARIELSKRSENPC